MLQLPVSGFSASTYGCFLALALFTQLVGHSSYNWALRWLSTHMIAVSLLGEPVGSTLLAFLLLSEAPTLFTVAGGVVVLAGIAVTATGR